MIDACIKYRNLCIKPRIGTEYRYNLTWRIDLELSPDWWYSDAYQSGFLAKQGEAVDLRFFKNLKMRDGSWFSELFWGFQLDILLVLLCNYSGCAAPDQSIGGSADQANRSSLAGFFISTLWSERRNQKGVPTTVQPPTVGTPFHERWARNFRECFPDICSKPLQIGHTLIKI